MGIEIKNIYIYLLCQLSISFCFVHCSVENLVTTTIDTNINGDVKNPNAYHRDTIIRVDVIDSMLYLCWYLYMRNVQWHLKYVWYWLRNGLL